MRSKIRKRGEHEVEGLKRGQIRSERLHQVRLGQRLLIVSSCERLHYLIICQIYTRFSGGMLAVLTAATDSFSSSVQSMMSHQVKDYGDISLDMRNVLGFRGVCSRCSQRPQPPLMGCLAVSGSFLSLFISYISLSDPLRHLFPTRYARSSLYTFESPLAFHSIRYARFYTFSNPLWHFFDSLRSLSSRSARTPSKIF